MKKILAIDDEEDIQLILKTFLEGKGYSVTTCGSATEALGLAKKEKFSVVISDIMMPGIDGLTFLKMLKKENRDAIVIMLSAHISIESAKTALNEGAFAYLTKPIAFEELRQTVERAFEKSSRIEEGLRLVKELSAQKEFHEALIDGMVYMVVAADAQGLIKKLNHAAEKMLGYDESELFGFPLSVIFSEESGQKDWPALISQGKVTDFPVVFLSKEQKEIHVSFTGTVLKDNLSRPTGFLGTARIRPNV